MMALVAAIAGVSTYAATGSIWMALGRMGLMMASTLLAPRNEGPVASDSGNTVPPVDPGLGFAPFPQYPTPEMPVPVIFGQARPNGLVVHSRIYGGDYQKAHYLVVLGEVGITMDQLYIDKYKIEELPNYYTRTGGNQNSDSSWFIFHPQGGQAQIALNNAGTWNIFQVTNTIGEMAAPVPVIFYGGGSVLCYSYHTWPKQGSTQAWKWILTNIDNPNQTMHSQVYSETFSSTQGVSCFPPGTMVMTPNGEKAIESFQAGDAILAYDESGRIHETQVATFFHHCSFETLIDLRTPRGQLTATDNHLILVRGKGFIPAGEIQTGDVLLNEAGRECPVSSWHGRRSEQRIHTYNLKIARYGTFIANGHRVHNDGGDKGESTVHIPGNDLRTHTFNVPDPLSRWSLKLVIQELTEGTEGGQMGIYKFDLNDVPFTENIRINAAFVHVHLVKDVSIGSNNPVINALVHSNVVTGLGGNPADAMLTFLTDPVTGLGLPSDSLDWSSQYATAYWCEQHGFGFNRAYAAFYDAEQVFREICAAGRIMTLIRDGRIYLKPDDVEPASYKVGEIETIPGSLRIGIHSASRPNRIEAQYVEPFYGYTTERIYVEDLDAIARDGQQIQTVDLTGVTDQTQAFKLAWFILRTIQDCPYWCKLKVGMETARVIPLGGVIEIESSTNAIIGAKQWRVLSIEETEAFIYQIECIQYNANVYQEPAYSPWYNQVTELEPVQGWPGPSSGPASVVNFQITNVAFPQGGGGTEITLDWIRPMERYDSVSIQWSHNGIDWIAAGSAINGPFNFTWPMRYGLVHIRSISNYGGGSNVDTAPTLTRYVSGRQDNDYPGYGRGQWGMQPYGY
ncbi:MAG: hypothetical protein HQL64_05950 [Magnetococcales bacterium]|nr:hypothetical protein [Magnetococcales bacterium]